LQLLIAICKCYTHLHFAYKRQLLGLRRLFGSHVVGALAGRESRRRRKRKMIRGSVMIWWFTWSACQIRRIQKNNNHKINTDL